MEEKRIVLTGGGTAGHVTPNLALIEPLKEKGYQLCYIGRAHSQEQELAEKAGLDFYPVRAGRFRRNFSLRAITEPFNNVAGFFDAVKILKKVKPVLVFAKGGFVSVPVAMAAWFCGISCVLHESDYTPGLANKLCRPFAKKLLVSFEETLNYLPVKTVQKGGAIYTGSPVRQSILKGSAEEGKKRCGFDISALCNKPVLLMMGGSTGAQSVNRALRMALPDLLQQFNVLHLCGKGNLDPQLNETPGYYQTEYAYEEIADYFAMTDIMISRSGANALMEILTLAIPAVLVPLSGNATRGDQILNAEAFERKGFSMMVSQQNLDDDKLAEELVRAVLRLWAHRNEYKSKMAPYAGLSGTMNVVREIENTIKQ